MGLSGYVFQSYLLPAPNTEPPDIPPNPEEPVEDIDLGEVTVFENPEDVFNSSLKIDGSIITGLNYMDTSVKTMKTQINTDLAVEFYNYKGDLLSDAGSLGTGSKIIFKDPENNIAAEYNIVLYGDVNR